MLFCVVVETSFNESPFALRCCRIAAPSAWSLIGSGFRVLGLLPDNRVMLFDLYNSNAERLVHKPIRLFKVTATMGRFTFL